MPFLAKTVLVAVALAANAATAAGPVCGDVNDSGTISTVDALFVLRKSVDQPVTLDCSAYEDEIATCEAGLGECSGDLMACLGGERCGDGIVNAVGEHCDESDLGGANCGSVGHEGGRLACDDECRFDASECGDCPEGTTPFNGSCWLLGASPTAQDVGSCDAACTSVGATCDALALVAVGSGGTDEDCRSALDAANPAGAPHPISAFSPSIADGCGPDLAGGCTFVEGFGPGNDGAQRVLVTGEDTNCAADLKAECFSVPRRVCACLP